MTEVICENCGTEPPEWGVDHARGEYTCRHCGMVQDGPWLDQGLERRTFADDPDSKRHQRGGPVRDGYVDHTANLAVATSIRGSKRAKTMLQKANQKLTGQINLEQRQWKKIRELCQMLNLEGRVADGARDIVYRFSESGGKQLPVVAGALAAIHLACAQLKVGRPLADLMVDLNIAQCVDLPTEGKVWSARKKIVAALPGVDTQTRPEDVILNFSITLELPPPVIEVARRIQTKIQPLVEGKTPSTVAGGCIVMACAALDVPQSKADVSAVAQVAASTLSSFQKIGKKHWSLVVPPPAELAKYKAALS